MPKKKKTTEKKKIQFLQRETTVIYFYEQGIEIKFVNGVFVKCHFPFSNPYSIEEWEKLETIAKEIQFLQEDYNNKVI